MEVPKSEIRAGDAILWKGGGPVDGSFSFILGLFFPIGASVNGSPGTPDLSSACWTTAK